MSKTLLLFTAPWCAPCKASKPALDSFMADHPGIVEVIDVQADPEAAFAHDVKSVPTILVQGPSGREGAHVGAYSKATLERLVGVSGEGVEAVD